MRSIIVLAICLCLISAPAGAEIYKCIDENGEVTFTTKPGPGCKLLPGSVFKQIICNKFKLITTLKGSMLTLSVDTDLPDNAVIMIRVSRAYFEMEKGTEYARDYFSEKSTVGKWRLKHNIYISNEKWKTGFKSHLKKMSRFGLGFDVASISDMITVRMVAPIRQLDPQFGKQNENLIGMAVKTNGIRVVDDEVQINYPLDSASLLKSRFPSLDPLSLEVGPIYILSKRTPLMPTHSPKDDFAALKQMRYIPKGTGFKVIRIFKKNGHPWYGVVALNRRKQRLGKGWINSSALLGQKLEVFE